SPVSPLAAARAAAPAGQGRQALVPGAAAAADACPPARSRLVGPGAGATGVARLLHRPQRNGGAAVGVPRAAVGRPGPRPLVPARHLCLRTSPCHVPVSVGCAASLRTIPAARSGKV